MFTYTCTYMNMYAQLFVYTYGISSYVRFKRNKNIYIYKNIQIQKNMCVQMKKVHIYIYVFQ